MMRATGFVSATLAVLCSASIGAPAAAAQLAASDTLTLDGAVTLALTRSPELRQAAARTEVARAGRVEAWGRFVPSVSLSAGLNQIGTLQRTALDPITGRIVNLPDDEVERTETFGTQAALSLDWTLFDGGQRYLQTREAHLEARAAELMLDAARARVAASVTIAYVDVLEADALLRVREADVTRARSLVEAAEARFELGDAPEIELLQARVSLNDAELALTEAEIQAEAARLVLVEHFGGGGPNPAQVLAEPRRPAAAEWSAERIRVCAIGRSAELEALGTRRRAGGVARSASNWAFLPTVRVGATWARTEFGNTREAITSDLRNEQTYYRLTLSWSPLDQPGRWLADRRRAAALEAEAAALLAARRPAIVRQVELELTRLSRARLLRDRAELNVELAVRQREQATERYRLGLAPITEMIQAESLAREAERQAVAARFADLRAIAELESAAGVSLDEMGTDCPE